MHLLVDYCLPSSCKTGVRRSIGDPSRLGGPFSDRGSASKMPHLTPLSMQFAAVLMEKKGHITGDEKAGPSNTETGDAAGDEQAGPSKTEVRSLCIIYVYVYVCSTGKHKSCINPQVLSYASCTLRREINSYILRYCRPVLRGVNPGSLSYMTLLCVFWSLVPTMDRLEPNI
jgi:hypothetical protein